MTKRKDPKDLIKTGAKEWKFDEELGKEICHAVSTSTDSYPKIRSANPHFPSKQKLNDWRFTVPAFGHAYAQAKMSQAELFAEEVIEISDNIDKDTLIDKDGNEAPNKEFIARSRLKIDTRKWIACKLAPKLYGDKTTTETHVYTHEASLKELE